MSNMCFGVRGPHLSALLPSEPEPGVCEGGGGGGGTGVVDPLSGRSRKSRALWLQQRNGLQRRGGGGRCRAVPLSGQLEAARHALRGVCLGLCSGCSQDNHLQRDTQIERTAQAGLVLTTQHH